MDHAAKIVVIEDEGLVALDLQDRLIKAGYEVPEVATSSEEGLQLVASVNPDLVLMDIRLRGPRDGIETALQIHESNPIPIIFVTANADPSTIQRASMSRPAGFFVKPVQFASLTSCIEMALYKARGDQYSALLAKLRAESEDIVLITDLDGKVEFASPALSRLIGVRSIDLIGQPLSSILSRNSVDDDDLGREILNGVEQEQSVRILKGSFISLPGGVLKIPVEGQAKIQRFGNGLTKAVFVLRDLSASEWSDQCMRAEQTMLARGHFASGISETMFRLFEMISTLRPSNSAEIALACDAGMGISRQITSVGEETAPTSELVDANEWLKKNGRIVGALLGNHVTVCLDLCSEPAIVRLPTHSLGQVLMSMFGSLRKRLAGPGSIHVKTHVVRGMRDNIRLLFRLERSGPAAWTPFVFPFESETSDLEISVANAIVTAAEGRLDYTQSWANTAQIEILLPRPQGAVERSSQRIALPREAVVLLVATGKAATRALEKQFAAGGYK